MKALTPVSLCHAKRGNCYVFQCVIRSRRSDTIVPNMSAPVDTKKHRLLNIRHC